MTKINEDLLDAWLRLSISVNNPRLVTEITYNESLICNILYKHAHSKGTTPLTATDLCKMTNMLKSQMNRTLNQLEEKLLVTRQRSTIDKRQVYVTMNWEGADKYRVQHERILKLVDGIIERLGKEQAEQTALLMTQIADIADDFLSEK